MNDKIQLKHPKGKSAIKIDAGKYSLIKKAILHHFSFLLKQNPKTLIQNRLKHFYMLGENFLSY